MKELKISMIAMVVVALILVLTCAYAVPSKAETEDFYPLLTVVINKEYTEYNDYVITVEDSNGNLWVFYSDSTDWQIGELVNLLMWRSTADPYDDEVIDVYRISMAWWR